VTARSPQRPASSSGSAWWSETLGYQVYLRSFADGNGDGVGDLPGLHERLDYLAWLGVETVWVTPFFPSPMADQGYDVADYTAVDELYGGLDAVDAVIARIHELGMRVIVEVVPNHTSDRHPWFQAALRSADDPHRDYYLWRDPAPGGGPPNNWCSYFGGPAWTLDERSGQYWLHLFLPAQPDLNWANSAVRREFERILTFWLERGVDGFRIDVAHALVKDPEMRDNPRRAAPLAIGAPVDEFLWFDHVYDIGQPGTTEIFAEWRRLADRYDAVLIGEVYLPDFARVARYVQGDGLHLAFTFPVLWAGWDAGEIRSALAGTAAALNGGACWVQGSHDEPRVVTRLGGGEQGRRRALALLTLLAGLPGPLFLYQGDELGLGDGVVPPERRRDPIAGSATFGGRDGARTPMPWEPGKGLGFTPPEVTPWLPEGGRTPADTVAVQRTERGSHLHLVRAVLALRRELRGPLQWLDDAGGPMVEYRRGDALVAANVGGPTAALPIPAGDWHLEFASSEGCALREGEALLATDAAVVLRRR
jgi:alpha-glucosidase